MLRVTAGGKADASTPRLSPVSCWPTVRLPPPPLPSRLAFPKPGGYTRLVADLAAPKVLENLIQQAERANASDIHLQKRADATQVAFCLAVIIRMSWTALPTGQ